MYENINPQTKSQTTHQDLFKPQLTIDKIALSAVNSKINIFPVGKNKIPLIPRWQTTGAGCCDSGQLERWHAQYKNHFWGMPCGPENNVFCVDVDFQKDEDKKPIGQPILGLVTYDMLSLASFTQNTQSLWKGNRTTHFFFKWEDRLKIFTNSRLGNTTIDIRTAKGQVVLYRELPPPELWEDLSPMSDTLFETLKSLLNVRSDNDWEIGNRNNTLFKKIALDMERNQGCNIPSFLEKAKAVGLPRSEVLETAKSAVKTAISGNHGIDPGPSLNESKAKPFEVIFYKKEKIADINWGIEDWFEYGDLALLGGPSGSGKSTLAIKLAVLNAQKRPFWSGGPVGDGRKSLYICFERKPKKAHNKELACGGDGKQLDIIKKLKNQKGDLIPLDLENPTHLKTTLDMIQKNNYWSVIFDPVVDLVLSNQNDNVKVRRQVTTILDKTHGLKTIFLGIAHLRKQKTGVDDLGSLRGASEIVNIATSVCKVFELKDGEGFVLGKLKVNESKIGKKGGIQYKIETLNINEAFLAEGSKEKGKGGIRELKYLNQPLNEIKKSCIKELDFGQNESPQDIIKKVIMRLEAENKELNTTIIKNLAFAEGVSKFYLNQKLNWSEFGMASEKIGKGKEYRVILKRQF